MLTEEKLVGIRDKMHFENFGGLFVIKYIKIPEISVFHKDIYKKYQYTNLQNLKPIREICNGSYTLFL